MDLYGGGMSIGQANSQAQSTRQANILSSQFNDSLAGQLDTARAENDQDALAKQQANMVSGATAGGKLLTSAKARSDLKFKGFASNKVGPTGFREVGVTDKEMLKEVAKKNLNPDGSRLVSQTGDRSIVKGADGVFEEREGGRLLRAGTRETFFAGGEEPPAQLLGEAEVGTSTEARAVEGAGEEGQRLLGGAVGGIETSADATKTAFKGGSEALLEGGLKAGAKAGAVGLAKVGLAGVGGALDIAKDIERGKGLFNADTYGSNNMQRIGNIGNIIGSGLEVAGLLTAWTPFGVGLEGLGALVSVGSTALETAGDIEDADDTQDTTEKDITSQARGESVTQTVQQATGRSE